MGFGDFTDTNTILVWIGHSPSKHEATGQPAGIVLYVSVGFTFSIEELRKVFDYIQNTILPAETDPNKNSFLQLFRWRNYSRKIVEICKNFFATGEGDVSWY